MLINKITKDSNAFDSFLIGALGTLILYGLLWIIFNYGIGQPDHRVYILLGGQWPLGLIQFSTFLAFFWAMVLVGTKSRKLKWETGFFALNLLPTDEHQVMRPEHINDLRLSLANLEEKSSILVTALQRACTKFRANKSPQETMDLVKIQIDMEMDLLDSSYGLIRYLAWSIPSIGFIGTVMGISGALGNADKAVAGDIAMVTSQLGVAFDTTLVALLLSIILMFQIHISQQKEESLIIGIHDYIIENFINRIYVPKTERG
ncbi:MAG: MotA/TolQ/ExbB proton channel family protein [Candidatus Marinimicrobia bacterium]|jgi:chemotaxis protein MotA|nr:MotA/TolQ/ExbB proton channel family protein [Candidatus Neomarinimicrobiota bacterium]MBT6930186.1 MotA/TolQ/ExbB proton channel family protein [Candidatus Neomarinimicrobiota bacterium]MBT7114331.1 MotA/TolQ/ExbB proton channel family protein [Candidatus Neomarinimicrobiota bacterium]